MKNPKKLTIVFVLFMFCCLGMVVGIYAVSNLIGNSDGELEHTIYVYIDGQRINFNDQHPIIQNDRALVPVRGVFEHLDYKVDWDVATNTVSLVNDVNVVTITVGKSAFITNETTYNLDVPASIINGRTMLPLRALLESIGYSVYWDGNKNTVFIQTNESEAYRLALIMLDDDGGGGIYEIVSDGTINYSFDIAGHINPLIDYFDVIDEGIQEDSDNCRSSYGMLIGKVQKAKLSSAEFEILNEMLDLLRRFASEEINNYMTGNGLRYIHAIIDGNLHGSEYVSSYVLEEGFEHEYYWDNVLLNDIAYFLLDTIPHMLNRYYWETPKELVEQGRLKDYYGLSTFYYRYGEEPKTHIVYTDHNKINSVLEWLEE